MIDQGAGFETNGIILEIKEPFSGIRENIGSPHRSRSWTRHMNGTKSTPAKGKTPDIRTYLDPVTGKRKTTESTPEKNNNEKKGGKVT